MPPRVQLFFVPSNRSSSGVLPVAAQQRMRHKSTRSEEGQVRRCRQARAEATAPSRPPPTVGAAD
jgi:hypothetical protein